MPPPPDFQDWIGAITDWGMMANDNLGDCVFAACGHAIQTWTANTTGNIVTLPDSDIVGMYSKWAGYNPNDPTTDNGYNEVDCLNNWQQQGFVDHMILGFADPDPGSLEHIKQTILLFGGAYLGLALPMSAQGEDVWSSTSDAPGTWGGHAVFAPSYDKDGIICITWGKPKRMTWNWFNKYCDEAHAILSQDFITGRNFSESGFDLATCKQDLLGLGT